MLSPADSTAPDRVATFPATGHRQDVLGQAHVGLDGVELGDQTVVDHGLRALAGLLTGLEQGEIGAGPLALVPGQQSGCAQPGRHVCVVAAGVHLPWFRGGVLQAGGLRHGKGIHVGAEEHPATVTVADDADDPAADLQDLVGTDLLQLPGHLLRGPRLLTPHVRVAVEVLVELLLPHLDLVDPGHHAAELGRSHRGVRRGRSTC